MPLARHPGGRSTQVVRTSNLAGGVPVGQNHVRTGWRAGKRLSAFRYGRRLAASTPSICGYVRGETPRAIHAIALASGRYLAVAGFKAPGLETSRGFVTSGRPIFARSVRPIGVRPVEGRRASGAPELDSTVDAGGGRGAGQRVELAQADHAQPLGADLMLAHQVVAHRCGTALRQHHVVGVRTV